MPNKGILKKSTVILVLLIASALAWGEQKKEKEEPARPAPKAAQPAKQAPSRPTAQPQRQPVRPTGGGASHGPTTTGTGTHGATTTGAGTHGATTTGAGTHGATTTGTGTHGATTGGGATHGPTATRPGGAQWGSGGGGGVHNVRAVGGRATTTRTLPGGRTANVTTRANGRVASIHSNGMTINHGVHGGRTIVSEHNGRTIVNEGNHGGYVQRPYFSRGGRTYYARTYVRDGRAYSQVYRGYNYRGGRYYGYVPEHYYHPGFYRWAYRPWGAVYFGPAAWGWVGSPWYGAYPGYFAPYPVYGTPALWLTDYLIAANMRAAYQAGVEAGREQQAPPPGQQYQEPPPGGPGANTQTPLSPEVKQAIADEVQQQLAAERAAAQPSNPQALNAPAPNVPEPNAPASPSGEQVPDALNPSERVFVVASNLDVMTPATGQECGLTPGDVLMRLADTPDANQNVTASVQSSKKGDCGGGQTIAVSVQDLQEMHNHFHEQLDAGLKTLADNSGKKGLPTAPDSSTTPGEVPAPPPDAGATDQLHAQQQQADQTEAQVQ